jgi:hypothetical protein
VAGFLLTTAVVEGVVGARWKTAAMSPNNGDIVRRTFLIEFFYWGNLSFNRTGFSSDPKVSLVMTRYVIS